MSRSIGVGVGVGVGAELGVGGGGEGAVGVGVGGIGAGTGVGVAVAVAATAAAAVAGVVAALFSFGHSGRRSDRQVADLVSRSKTRRLAHSHLTVSSHRHVKDQSDQTSSRL